MTPPVRGAGAPGAPAAPPAPVPTPKSAPRTPSPAAPPSPPSAAQLELIQQLIRAGALARALTLLDGLWPRGTADEHCWYLRLWILVGQGRHGEARELAREAGMQLPGSASVAWLQAGLERAAGDRPAAMEAALRAAAILPGVAGPERMLAALLAEAGDDSPVPPDPELPPPPPPEPAPWLNLTGAALTGAAWLHPFGSHLPYQSRRVLLPWAARGPDSQPDGDRRTLGIRLWWLALASLVAAALAFVDPLLGAGALALALAILTRPPRR